MAFRNGTIQFQWRPPRLPVLIRSVPPVCNLLVELLTDGFKSLVIVQI